MGDFPGDTNTIYSTHFGTQQTVRLEALDRFFGIDLSHTSISSVRILGKGFIEGIEISEKTTH
jgi:hypothetical protein